MPVALETSKRKFQRLLDSLTSTASSTPTPSKAIDPSDPASKRARLSPRTRLTYSHPLVTSSTDVRRIPRAHSSHSTAPTPAAQGEGSRGAVADTPPYYTPWSTPAFLTRLRTFADVSRWSEKPASIDEVAWARRGWVLDPTGKDKVACKGGCEERVIVSLRSPDPGPAEEELDTNEEDKSEEEADDSNAIDEELTRRYTELLATGHAEGCAWRDRGCGDQVMRMPLARTTVWQDGLLQRYQSFVADGMQGRLPQPERMTSPAELDVEGVAASLTADFIATAKDGDARIVASQVSAASTQAESHDGGGKSPATSKDPQLIPQPINSAALTFALLGWHAPTPPTRNPKLNACLTAECGQCFRRLGLWLYSPSSPMNDEEDPPARLDLTSSHRDYCPWISAASQSNPAGGALEGLNGWQTLRKVVGNWAGLQERARRRRLGDEAAASLESAAVNGDREAVNGVAGDASGTRVVTPSPARSREEVRKEDNARFKRLRDLTRAMGFKKRPKTTETASVG